jgi:hypothetical protein
MCDVTLPSLEIDQNEINLRTFLFVVTLYGVSMDDSQTVHSLRQFRDKHPGIHLLILDNTPGGKAGRSWIDGETDYVSFGENKGLAQAYETAFHIAKATGYRFLVLLDQDSEVSSGFLHALNGVANQGNSSVAIWCPDVICNGKPVSPYSLNMLGWPNFRSGTASNVYGINSFSVVNVRFIELIGGFEHFYWLDCLDSWLYEQAHLSYWSIKRLETSVDHDLSLVSGKITLARLQNIAFYESCFALEYGSGGRILGTIFRLILRGIKRTDVIGGILNSFDYLGEIIKGAVAGWGRRGAKKSRTKAPLSNAPQDSMDSSSS